MIGLTVKFRTSEGKFQGIIMDKYAGMILSSHKSKAVSGDYYAINTSDGLKHAPCNGVYEIVPSDHLWLK